MIEHLADVNRYGSRQPSGPWGPLPGHEAVAGLKLLQDAVVAADPELQVDERLQALVQVLGLQDGVDAAIAVPYDTSGVAGPPLLSRADPALADELRPLLQAPGVDQPRDQPTASTRDWVGVALPGKSGLTAHLYVFGQAGGAPLGPSPGS